ncbi:FAD binding domain-containing protein [Gordonia sp. C13]|uniref:FAD binding domain-containing protein n=1 Tax=Gordonia sp. C13 TaxID=2935078 RepID=UPI00200A32B5|nr:FAD binding domain-containing protein [Gordonia sp. C13]MCK8615323.1 FAD binding domain-containing protein [Gordonia sp. C13]
MKTSKFSIHQCRSVVEACDLLSRLDDVKILAGGQSLVPLMNQRIVSPSNLVDINNVSGLNQVTVTESGVTIGATVRQSAVEKSADVRSQLPVIGAALAHVGHPQIRNRGTVVGSICHAEASAEVPAVLSALGGKITVSGASGERDIDVADFYRASEAAPLAADELATAVTFDALGADTGWSFQEVTRRKFGVAIVGVVTVVTVTDGTISNARIAVHGAGTVNRRVAEFEAALIGADSTAIDRSGEAILDLLAPTALSFASDFHASAGYRRVAARQLVAKGIRTAVRRAAAASPVAA